MAIVPASGQSVAFYPSGNTAPQSAFQRFLKAGVGSWQNQQAQIKLEKQAQEDAFMKILPYFIQQGQVVPMTGQDKSAERGGAVVEPTFGMSNPGLSTAQGFKIGNINQPFQFQQPPQKGTVKEPLPGYENIPAVYDYNDLGQYYGAKEKEGWASGNPSTQAIYKAEMDSIYNTGRPAEEKIRLAKAAWDKLNKGKIQAPSTSESPVTKKASAKDYSATAMYAGKKVYSHDKENWFDAEGNPVE